MQKSNILTLGYFVEGILAVVNKKRKAHGVSSLPNLESVLGREPTKWLGEYQGLKNLVMEREIPMTVIAFPCPHTMQSFWDVKLFELTRE